jgi:DNA end-binding protein Ku
MAARSIASLTIAFGLVAIPVKLYSATVSSERLRFHLLHAKDGSRLKQQYVCAEEQRVVGGRRSSRATSSPRTSM